jgi:hypothetical protein
VHGRVDRAVAFAGEDVRRAVDIDREADALGAAVFEEVVLAVAMVLLPSR